MRGAAFVLILLALTSFASAGTEQAPEIRDGRDVTEPGADILGVWFEDDARGVRITASVRELRSATSSHMFFTLLNLDGERRSVSLGFGPTGDLVAQTRYTGHARDNDLVAPQFRPGAPAYFTAVIPWGAWGALSAGDAFRNLEAYSSYYKPGMREWAADYDHAYGGGTFLVGGTSVAPADSGSTRAAAGEVPAGLLLVGTTLAGATAGYLLMRRREGSTRKP